MRLKYLVSIVIVSVIFVYGLSTLLHPEFNRYLNRVGKAQYYTVILEDGKIDPKASGKILTTFRYRLPAYNANGDKWLLDFSAIKQLRHHAYLRLYVKTNGTVTAWEEVSREQLPVVVQQAI